MILYDSFKDERSLDTIFNKVKGIRDFEFAFYTPDEIRHISYKDCSSAFLRYLDVDLKRKRIGCKPYKYWQFVYKGTFDKYYFHKPNKPIPDFNEKIISYDRLVIFTKD